MFAHLAKLTRVVATVSLSRLSWWLLLSWLLVAVALTGFGFAGLLALPVWLLLTFPSLLLVVIVSLVLLRLYRLTFSERLLLLFLAAVLALHFAGVLVPETGFDALWYHLPVVAHFLSQERIVYLPELYQSANPLLVEMTFLAGFQLAVEFGAKLVAYGWMLTLLITSYGLARRWLTRNWSLVAILIIALFQPVAWQASSFYVDVAKAVWDLALVWALFSWRDSPLLNQKRVWLLVVGILLGASVATKLFSLLLVPVVVVIVLLSQLKNHWQDRISSLLLVLVAALVIAAPYYFYTYIATGTAFYSLTAHVSKLAEIGGTSTVSRYIWQRVSSSWQLPWMLVVARDYTSLALVVFFPLTWWWWQQRARWDEWVGVLYIGAHLAIWWFVPPLSTRYALAGFALWVIFTLAAVAECSTKPNWRQPLLVALMLTIGWQVAHRLFVAQRLWPYLSGKQTESEYLQQFYDGNIDQKIQEWYSLP